MQSDELVCNRSGGDPFLLLVFKKNSPLRYYVDRSDYSFNLDSDRVQVGKQQNLWITTQINRIKPSARVIFENVRRYQSMDFVDE